MHTSTLTLGSSSSSPQASTPSTIASAASSAPQARSAALGFALLAGLAACATRPEAALAGAPVAAPLALQTHAAGAAGFHVTSTLVSGPTEAVLVDAQFTRSEARKVAALVRASGKRLKTVFVTHGHPDHYFGVEVLRQEFPETRFVTTTEALADIAATGPGKLAYWKPIYGDDLTGTLPELAAVTPADMTVDGESLEILEVGAGESAHATIVRVPGLDTVIAGDALYDGVHLWLAEGRLDGVVANLGALEGSGARRFVPGHSVTGALSDTATIAANRAYVAAARAAVSAPGATAQSAAAALKAAYPTLALPVIADISVQALLVP